VFDNLFSILGVAGTSMIFLAALGVVCGPVVAAVIVPPTAWRRLAAARERYS
jgi:hypothetical protein